MLTFECYLHANHEAELFRLSVGQRLTIFQSINIGSDSKAVRYFKIFMYLFGCRGLSCHMQDFRLWHVGSSPLTRD